MHDKELIIAALASFMKQRPRLEFGNYGDISSYRAELRSITKDLHHARELLRAVALSSITGEALAAAFKHAFSGRLTLTAVPTKTTECRLCPTIDHYKLDYCTGQYWPTEYRRAVCAVCASALWEYKRDHCMPEPTFADTGDRLYRGVNAGDFLRGSFRREFGRSIANRWFN